MARPGGAGSGEEAAEEAAVEEPEWLLEAELQRLLCFDLLLCLPLLLPLPRWQSFRVANRGTGRAVEVYMYYNLVEK